MIQLVDAKHKIMCWLYPVPKYLSWRFKLTLYRSLRSLALNPDCTLNSPRDPLKNAIASPGLHGSVDWVPACKPKGCQFDSQSEYMPGLQARSAVGGTWEATTHWCFSHSLSVSLPLCLKINKIFKEMPMPKPWPGWTVIPKLWVQSLIREHTRINQWLHK